ncbi:choline dehydrogenase [Aspergillus heteromorphus CBS 117.55]|uniref:Choline dehydrogenase n=1 Tax=Aspergillus heteromorphus CBS 117.55 TaxID=1448321 RepID=A0A317UUP8_9EURO|nr:choline dehydrogenase [Aspergillus heteromorphus CBS 117.55]PWY64267.1 choline dehydrogenase [Aspergillus heteromorphus CBS 117.55]
MHLLLHLLLSTCTLVTAVDLTGYEYIVVGSGAGGGPVAARLALAGHKTLVIESGDDPGLNPNYSVPGYAARASEDPTMVWNFFVRHYADEARQALDFKTTYTTPSGEDYTGLHPPRGSTMKGILYPRAGALGGCTAHHALISMYPHRTDFEYIANLTNDPSWAPDHMRQYFTRLEDNHYLGPGAAGHGYTGWLSTQTAPINLVLKDPQFLSLLVGGARAFGNQTAQNLASLVLGDANADSVARDTDPGYYQIPLSTADGRRTGSRELLVAVASAVHPNGSRKFPLTLRTNCHATKLLFDSSISPPRATGVAFLDGKHLYRASPLSPGTPDTPGTPGTATATHEIILSAGVFNTPQLLLLSGIGPAPDLLTHNIPLIAHLPGVGHNLQDQYEIAVQSSLPSDFKILAPCTFTPLHDPCLDRWLSASLPISHRGIYSTTGFGAAMLYKSAAATDNAYDVFIFGGLIDFRGYFPRFSHNVTQQHNIFTWSVLKAHPRNRAGVVRLRSADPLDVPEILFNYFDTGSDGWEGDEEALEEAVAVARRAFAEQKVPATERLPGREVTGREMIRKYIRDTAWGHHASCSCAIGGEGDEMAVLDGQFRVRGVSGVRVVDASVFPRIPGTFTAVSTYLVGEKAAEVILKARARGEAVEG